MDKVLTFSQYRSPTTVQTPVQAASRPEDASFGSSCGPGGGVPGQLGSARPSLQPPATPGDPCLPSERTVLFLELGSDARWCRPQTPGRPPPPCSGPFLPCELLKRCFYHFPHPGHRPWFHPSVISQDLKTRKGVSANPHTWWTETLSPQGTGSWLQGPTVDPGPLTEPQAVEGTCSRSCGSGEELRLNRKATSSVRALEDPGTASLDVGQWCICSLGA